MTPMQNKPTGRFSFILVSFFVIFVVFMFFFERGEHATSTIAWRHSAMQARHHHHHHH
jgi:hypothetical protein